MTTLSALSLDFTDCTGGSADVPDNDIARLMYYLRCVTKGVGLNFLQNDLIRYERYSSLSPARTTLVFQTALELSPDQFIDKLIFRDDDREVVGNSLNKFIRISAAYNIASLQSDILLMGEVRNATEVMFFRSSWLDRYYTQPIQRLAYIILGTKHCAHCDGADGLCTCSTCPRTAEGNCMDIVDVLLDVFNAAIPSGSAIPQPGPVTTLPQGVEKLRPEQHYCHCDGCGWRFITGVRYKCADCNNYDLCANCYRGNIHDMGHRFNQYVTPGASPVLLAVRAEALPSLPPHTQADTATNHSPPLYSSIPSTSTSSSPFFYITMSLSQLKSFLNDHGVAFDDILDKETLCRRAWDTHCDLMGIVELDAFLSENFISTADCRDVASRRQKVKDAFFPPPRPPPPSASTNTALKNPALMDTALRERVSRISALRDTASRITASRNTASMNTASRNTGSRNTVTASRNTGSRNTVTASRNTASRNTTARNTTSRNTTSRDTTSRDTTSRNTTSRNTSVVKLRKEQNTRKVKGKLLRLLCLG